MQAANQALFATVAHEKGLTNMTAVANDESRDTEENRQEAPLGAHSPLEIAEGGVLSAGVRSPVGAERDQSHALRTPVEPKRFGGEAVFRGDGHPGDWSP
jgi:hypothetical protein